MLAIISASVGCTSAPQDAVTTTTESVTTRDTTNDTTTTTATTTTTTITTTTTTTTVKPTTTTTTTKKVTTTSTTQTTTPTTVPTKQVPTELTQDGGSAVAGRETDDRFVNAYMNWAVNVFQKSAAEKRNENVIISPLSIHITLGMMANGAKGATQDEILRAIGGDIPLKELNGYMNTLFRTVATDEKSALSLANAVWLRRDIATFVKPTFLQTVSDQYRASVYAEEFNDTALQNINAWVNEKTDGRIDGILDHIGKDDMVYLLNAAALEEEWQVPYHRSQVAPGKFNAISGKERDVSMMRKKVYYYYDDGDALGFKLPLKRDFNFSVLLPNEGTNVYDYIQQLTAEDLLATLGNSKEGEAITRLPKFECESSFELKEILKSMGVRQVFSKNADFSNMLTEEPFNLSNVRHKANITVDEVGTRAGASTITIMTGAAPPKPRPDPIEITLDRPFVYMITESKTNIPVFIGVVTDIKK